MLPLYNYEVWHPCTYNHVKNLNELSRYVLGVPSLVVVMEVINFSTAHLPYGYALITMLDPITCLPVTKRTSFGENAQQFTMPACLSMMLRHCPLI